VSQSKQPNRVTAIPADRLRWLCDSDALSFESTEEVEPIAGVIGQPLALEALHFGLACDAPGQNVYVRGLQGTGRMSMVKRLLTQMNPMCDVRAQLPATGSAAVDFTTQGSSTRSASAYQATCRFRCW